MNIYQIDLFIDENVFIRKDIFNNFDFSLNLSINDMKDFFSKQKKSNSTTIQIIGDEDIDNIFNFFYESKNIIDLSDFEKINKKIKARIIENSFKLLEGFVILKNIINDNEKNIYEFIFFEETLFFIKEFENKKINEILDYSKYNHLLNSQAVWYSMNDYIYKNGYLIQRNDGEGYEYLLGFYGDLTEISPNNYQSLINEKFNTHKIPIGFRVKEMINEIANYFKIDIDIDIDEDILNNMIISGNSDKMKKIINKENEELTTQITINRDIITNNNFDVNVSSGIYAFSKKLELDHYNIYEISDNDNQFIDNVFIVKSNGNCSILIQGEDIIQKNNIQLFGGLYIEIYVDNIKKLSENVYYFNYLQSNTTFFNFNKKIDLGKLNNDSEIKIIFIYSFISYTQPQNNYYFSVSHKNNNPYTIYFNNKKVKYHSFLINEINEWLPNITISEFFRNLTKLFNFYVFYDKNENKLCFKRYENLNIFYDSKNPIIIDDYVDLKEKIIISHPISEYKIKEIRYTYKSNNELNKEYYNKTQKNYGEKKISISNDNDKEILNEITFDIPIICKFNTLHSEIISFFKKEDNKYKFVDFNNFIVFKNKLVNYPLVLIDIDYSNNTYYTNAYNKFPIFSYTFVSNNKKLSFLFETPSYLFYSSPLSLEIETSENLYNKYIYNDMLRLIDTNSRLIKLELSPIFFKKYFINDITKSMITAVMYKNDLFLINKINNYNLNNKSISVEMLKIIDIKKKTYFFNPINSININDNVNNINKTTLINVTDTSEYQYSDNELYIRNKKIYLEDYVFETELYSILKYKVKNKINEIVLDRIIYNSSDYYTVIPELAFDSENRPYFISLDGNYFYLIVGLENVDLKYHNNLEKCYLYNLENDTFFFILVKKIKI